MIGTYLHTTCTLIGSCEYWLLQVKHVNNSWRPGLMFSNYVIWSGGLFHYRAQRSWGKVMFLQASVILLTGGVPGQVPPWDQVHPSWDQVHPPSRHPPGPGTPQPPAPGPGTLPWDQVHPSGPDTPPRTPPPRAEHAGRYGQCAGGTHPAGMQSCVEKNQFFFVTIPGYFTLGSCFQTKWSPNQSLVDIDWHTRRQALSHILNCPFMRIKLGFVYRYHQRHRFSCRLKMGSMQSYGAVYT